MKRILAFFILLSHINYTMFIPQTDEVDTYNANGQQTADINTLYEYIDEIVLGNTDVTAQDEDDDTARYFHVVKSDTYTFSPQAIEIDKAYNATSSKTKYPPFIEHISSAPDSDIQSPPPEA